MRERERERETERERREREREERKVDLLCTHHLRRHAFSENRSVGRKRKAGELNSFLFWTQERSGENTQETKRMQHECPNFQTHKLTTASQKQAQKSYADNTNTSFFTLSSFLSINSQSFLSLPRTHTHTPKRAPNTQHRKSFQSHSETHLLLGAHGCDVAFERGRGQSKEGSQKKGEARRSRRGKGVKVFHRPLVQRSCVFVCERSVARNTQTLFFFFAAIFFSSDRAVKSLFKIISKMRNFLFCRFGVVSTFVP